MIERKKWDSLSTSIFNIIDTVSANDTVYYDESVEDSANYSYRIYAFNKDTISDFSNIATIKVITSIEKETDLPKQYALYQNFPNPFNPYTKIRYSIPEPGRVKISVYNIIGEEIVTLVNREKEVGYYEVEFDGSNLPSGVYLYKLQSNNYTEFKKMILMK